METEKVIIIDKKEKLWNKNFFLLWQGQLVSAFGDVVYEMALGFWVLALTGSTALMGTLMAASMLPRVLISPFAGVIVDRSDRKWMIVLMDVVRGVFITFVGIAALFGFIQLWMVFAAGIIMGISAAFFNPAVSSSIPDLVPKDKLIKANSVMSIAFTSTNFIGSAAGGFIYKVIGAPMMFLANGISYLFSAFTEIFIKVPKIQRKAEKTHFKEDFKEGFKFVWSVKGLRYLIIMASALNFFASIAMVLMLPMFQQSEALGPEKYGLAMGLFTIGMVGGMLYTSIGNIQSSKKYNIFMMASIIFTLASTIFPLFNNFYIIIALLFVSGFFNAIVNALINSSVQYTVPQELRGKVFGLMNTVVQGLTPIALAFGGILGEFLPIRLVICLSFGITFVLILGFAFIQSFKRFIAFDPEVDKLEDLMEAV